MYRANSFAETRGRLGGWSIENGHFGSAKIDSHRSIHISELPRESVINGGAAHPGFDGYLFFETDDDRQRQGLNVLARVVSLDAAFTMLDLWQMRLD